MKVLTSRNECLTLADAAMSSGGEGELHAVLFKPASFASKDICVKIYFKSKRSKQLEQKLLFMAANPPQNKESEGSLLAWPLEVVYNTQKMFLGFVMPLAFANSEPLIYLTEKKISKKLDPIWSQKFDRSLGAYSMIARLKLICNIAISVHKLHVTNRYVLRDFKPENVLVTPEGKVTLVDMDSIQITDTNGTEKPMFHDFSATPNYMPPEHYTNGVGKNPNVAVRKSWDYFSLGVVFYQIVFGLHPYVVNPLHVSDDNSNDIYRNVAQNLFPFGPNHEKISSYPPLHDNFKYIPLQLQDLFKSAFSSDPNARPSLEIWVKSIKEIIRTTPTPQPPSYGILLMTTSHDFAVEVWVDDQHRGRITRSMSPLNIKVSEGKHKVYVNAGAKQCSCEVWVNYGETKSLNVWGIYEENKSHNVSPPQPVIYPSKNVNNTSSDKSGCIWGITIVLILGTAFMTGIILGA